MNNQSRVYPKRFLMMLFIAALTITVAALPACSLNPATGKKQLNMLSYDEEINLGSEAAPEFIKEYGGDIPVASIQSYVSNLGYRLAEVSERSNLPWEFHAVDSDVLNAFALPGGKVFVTRKLLSLLTSEAQLAGVLGHEIGHVTAQHAGQQMTQAMILQGISVGIGIAADSTDKDWLHALGVGADVGGTVYLLKYGRDQEDQADQLGVRYMAKLGYNPVGQLEVMRILEKQSAEQPQAPAILSTHPLPKDRIRRLEETLRKQYPDFEDPDAYQTHAQAYTAAVLEPLKTLPPAKHPPKEQPPAKTSKNIKSTKPVQQGE
jgi:predicted Zn-dependent protease